GDDVVGHSHDLGGGSIVADEFDDGGVRIARGETGQVRGGGTRERVDRLARVTHHTQVVAVTQPGVQQQFLQGVDVLELVDDVVAVLVPDTLGDRRVIGDHPGREFQHRLEVQEVV